MVLYSTYFYKNIMYTTYNQVQHIKVYKSLLYLNYIKISQIA